MSRCKLGGMVFLVGRVVVAHDSSRKGCVADKLRQCYAPDSNATSSLTLLYAFLALDKNGSVKPENKLWPEQCSSKNNFCGCQALIAPIAALGARLRLHNCGKNDLGVQLLIQLLWVPVSDCAHCLPSAKQKLRFGCLCEQAAGAQAAAYWRHQRPAQESRFCHAVAQTCPTN